MSNRVRSRAPSRSGPVGPAPGFWRKVRGFVVWFFAPRVAPRAWQRKPYLRSPNRRPGRFSR